MVSKVCQYSGLPLDNPRAKNHPLVTRLLNRADQEGVYGAVRDAMWSAVAAGRVGQAVIDAGEAALPSAVDRNRARSQQAADAALAAEQERRTTLRRRDAVNSALSRAGYRWQREDEESMDRFGATAFNAIYGGQSESVWFIVAPDGRTLSLQQALAEIGRVDLVEVAR
jgi:hypothetical protein